MRVYGLKTGLSTIEEHLSKPSVVLDLRNLKSDMEETTSLGCILAAKEFAKLQLLGSLKTMAQSNQTSVQSRSRQ